MTAQTRTAPVALAQPAARSYAVGVKLAFALAFLLLMSLVIVTRDQRANPESDLPTIYGP